MWPKRLAARLAAIASEMDDPSSSRAGIDSTRSGTRASSSFVLASRDSVHNPERPRSGDVGAVDTRLREPPLVLVKDDAVDEEGENFEASPSSPAAGGRKEGVMYGILRVFSVFVCFMAVSEMSKERRRNRRD